MNNWIEIELEIEIIIKKDIYYYLGLNMEQNKLGAVQINRYTKCKAEERK